MKCTKWVLSAALVCGFTGAFAAGPNDARLKELDTYIREHRVSHINGTWCDDYLSYYTEDKLSDADREANRQKVLDALAEREKLAGEHAAYQVEFGTTLLTLKRFAEALPHFEKAVPGAKSLDRFQRGELAVGHAECLYALGKKDEAVRVLDAYVKTREPTNRRGTIDWAAVARDALRLLRDGPMTLDELKLPRDTGAKAYPEPQQAKYTESFASVREIAIDLKGVAKDDARVRLLVRKLTRFGAKVSFGASDSFVLTVAQDAAAPVDKPEGYTLAIGAKGAKIAAREAQGVLWGLVSFLQCIDQKALAARQCEIVDWPVGSARGFLSCTTDWSLLEFSIFNKLNSVDVQGAWWGSNHCTPFQELFVRTQAKDFRDFGLTLYYGIAAYTMYPHLPLCKERTFRKHVEICKFYASAGAGVYFPYDDARFTAKTKSGLHPLDEAAFGTAAKSDAPYVTRVYREVKKEFPEFKMIFCPPFYWGPDSAARYPEDRETYLKTIAASLDPEIEVYWTGPMVKGYDKSPEQVKWYADLIGRKPSIFQNGAGAHNLLCYGVDPTLWNVWHGPGFVESVSAFHLNAFADSQGAQIGTLGDYLWNPSAYEPFRSVRRSVGQLVSFEVYDTLAPVLADLTYFDKYKYGAPNIEIMHEKVEDLQARHDRAEAAWKKANALDPGAVDHYLSGFGRGLGFARELIKAAKNPPNFMAKYKDAVVALEKQAVGEVGYDKQKGDILCTPISMGGGDVFAHTSKKFKDDKQNRLVKCMRGSLTAKAVLSGNFECDPFPPSGDYEFIVVCSEDERKAENTLALEINGTEVWKSASGMPNDDYGILRITVPFKTMKRYNTFAFKNLTPGTNNNGTPWFVVNYIVIRKGR